MNELWMCLRYMGFVVLFLIGSLIIELLIFMNYETIVTIKKHKEKEDK